MREQRNDPKRLNDILQAIDSIFQYVDGRSMEDFLADKMAYHAVIYNIMIIGEAANMLTFEFREAHSDLKWRQITNMRNFLIHGYHNVEEDLVWEVDGVNCPCFCVHRARTCKKLLSCLQNGRKCRAKR